MQGNIATKNPSNHAGWFKGFSAKYHYAGLVFMMLHSTAVFWGTGLIVLSLYSDIPNRRFKIYTIIHSHPNIGSLLLLLHDFGLDNFFLQCGHRLKQVGFCRLMLQREVPGQYANAADERLEIIDATINDQPGSDRISDHSGCICEKYRKFLG